MSNIATAPYYKITITIELVIQCQLNVVDEIGIASTPDIFEIPNILTFYKTFVY